MQSPAGQRSAARGRKKLSIGRLGSMQIFLGFLVLWIEPQRLTKLNHGLRDLALTEINFAEIVIGDCQLRIRTQRRQIMHLRLSQIPLCKERVGKPQLGVRVIRPELQNSPKLTDVLIVFTDSGKECRVAVMRFY